MQSTFFLYLDILGFADLVEKSGEVEKLFRILDSAAIIFSDTVLAYNAHDSLTGTAKATEAMFLIELVQDLFLRLIGTGARTRGSHRQFKHPSKPGTVTVSGKPGIDVPHGTLNSIMKQAGLK